MDRWLRNGRGTIRTDFAARIVMEDIERHAATVMKVHDHLFGSGLKRDIGKLTGALVAALAETEERSRG